MISAMVNRRGGSSLRRTFGRYGPEELAVGTMTQLERELGDASDTFSDGMGTYRNSSVRVGLLPTFRSVYLRFHCPAGTSVRW